MEEDKNDPPYQRCVMGGTFDRLHEAHEVLLRTAAYMAKEVFVGIVSEELGREKFAEKELGEMIQPYNIRAGSVKSFLKQFTKHPEVEPLYDPWGPAPTDPKADLIVVSYETEGNAQKINEMRKENNLTPLDIIVIPYVYVDGEKISSTLLRRKEAQKS